MLGIVLIAVPWFAFLAGIAYLYQRQSGWATRFSLQMRIYTSACVSALFLTDVSLTTALWAYGIVSGFIVYWVLRTSGRESMDFPDDERAAFQQVAADSTMPDRT